MSDGTHGGDRTIGGRYRVTGTLGHGGMATVYRAVDTQLGREVAVKVFRMGPVDNGERARAEAEIQALANLRNPSLVTLYDAAIADTDGESYLVMELVPGTDLSTRLRNGALAPRAVAQIGTQVADALAAVHEQGIVHRDVKPANVLLEDGRTGASEVRAKLADFGIALLRDSARMTGTGTVMGTAAYLAPEQVTAQDMDGEADVYALGLVLLESLTGRQAFPGTAIESATARLARGPQIDQALPVAWRTLLHTMTAMDADDRPTAAEAADRLRALARDGGGAAAADGGGPAPTAVLGGAAAAAAGAAVGAGAAGSGAANAAPRSGVDGDSGSGAGNDPTVAFNRPAGADAQHAQNTQNVQNPDDVRTTVLGRAAPQDTSRAATAGDGRRSGVGTASTGGAGAGAAGTGSGAGRPPEDSADQAAARRRRTWIVVAVIVLVLAIAAIVIGVVFANRDDTVPAPTDTSTSSTPPEESTPAPSQEVPSEEPSEPTQPEQTTEPDPVPSEVVPTTGPEPSAPDSLPVETPASVTNGKGGAPGNSGDAPGHNKGPGSGG